MPGPEPIGPSIDYVLRRTQILKEHADAVLEVKDRAVRAFGERMLLEIEWLVGRQSSFDS